MTGVNLAVRAVLSLGAVMAYRAADTAHNMVSPLISGPVAAQQLTDSNSAFVGTQMVSQAFAGGGVSSYVTVPLLALALWLIWRGPVRLLLNPNHKD
jgi:hypothetical protein